MYILCIEEYFMPKYLFLVPIFRDLRTLGIIKTCARGRCYRLLIIIALSRAILLILCHKMWHNLFLIIDAYHCDNNLFTIWYVDTFFYHLKCCCFCKSFLVFMYIFFFINFKLFGYKMLSVYLKVPQHLFLHFDFDNL